MRTIPNNIGKTQHLEPPTQPFETEVAWLYQKYKYKTPKKYSLKLAQYTLPYVILENFIDSYQITHSYFLSLITCPTILKHFYSQYPRDKVFGSICTSFQYKWQGHGYAHPQTDMHTNKPFTRHDLLPTTT